MEVPQRKRKPEPEIIPPYHEPPRPAARIHDATLETVARLLDDVFVIPGTSIRFGLDPLIGLIPGFGDLITGLASFLIIFAGWQRNLPRVTIARMVANVAIDTLVGTVPLLGDAFDAAWKSNRKNLSLLQRSSGAAQLRRHTLADTLFLAIIAAGLLALTAAPLVLLWWLLKR